MPARPDAAAVPLHPVLVFAAVFLAAVAATLVAREAVPGLRGLAQTITEAERPPDGDHYLANDIGGAVDHHVHFFGTDPEVVRRMREADVLFLGNSRLMYALRPGLLRPFFEAAQLRYYVMGFSYREADRFPLEIIRRFDLRPRLVVVNGDGFFGGGLSTWAEIVNRDSPFSARKMQWEAEAGHEARRMVHQLVPNWLRLLGLPGLGVRRTFIAYRSRTDGTWELSPWPEGTDGFRAPTLHGPAPGRGEIAAARDFKAELDRRGSRLVLTLVPSPEPMPGAGPARFAELLNVPLIVADVPALTTADHSHLSRASAHDWTRAFIGALAPVVQELTSGTGATPR